MFVRRIVVRVAVMRVGCVRMRVHEHGVDVLVAVRLRRQFDVDVVVVGVAV